MSIFTDKQLKSFKKNIKYGDIDPPTKLNGLSNVWCTCFIVFSTLLLLNIVETVKKRLIKHPSIEQYIPTLG